MLREQDAWELAIINRINGFNLIADTIERAESSGSGVAHLSNLMKAEIIHDIDYAHAHGG